MNDLTHAYVVRRSCGHPCAFYVDDGSAGLSHAVAKDIRAGRTVERVTIADARAIGLNYCGCTLSDKENLAVKRETKASRRRGRR